MGFLFQERSLLVRFVLMDILQALSMPLLFSKRNLFHMGVQTFYSP